MLIAGLLCLCAAVVAAGLAVRTLLRPHPADGPADVNAQVARAVAPIQLTAAVMLAAGGLVGLVSDASTGLVVLIVCVIGAVGTVAAGSWQSARYALRREQNAGDGCAGSCTACTMSCSSDVAS
jgi:hypothetical protein